MFLNDVPALCIFLASTLGITLHHREKLRQEVMYQAALKRMFTLPHRPSRHPRSQFDGPSEIDTERKNFFNEIYTSSGLSNRTKVIHVAGTKGKGSTCEYISAALRAAGHKVGVFTSPHLHTTCERIKIGNKIISREDLLRLSSAAFEVTAHLTWPVFFDILLIIALKYFGEHGVDYIVLESGIGGRFDSTNFYDNTAVCVITNISYDHQALLGNSLSDIGWQKAGIIKPGAQVFTCQSQDADVLRAIMNECDKKKATCHIVDLDIESTLRDIGGVVEKPHFPIEAENLCVAVAALKCLRVPSLSGLRTFYWPCRMETFCVDGVTIVLDGCHNGKSVELCMTGLRSYYKDSDLWILFGAGLDKCILDMMQEIGSKADQLIFAQASHFRAFGEQQLLDKLPVAASHKIMPMTPAYPQSHPIGTVALRLAHAIEVAKRQQQQTGRKIVICACGSLFIAADGREYLYRYDDSLFGVNDWVRYKDPVIL